MSIFEPNNNQEGSLITRSVLVIAGIIVLAIAIIAAFLLMDQDQMEEEESGLAADTEQISWGSPALDEVPEGMMGDFIRYGHELITQTYQHVGPNVTDSSKRFAGNNLACQNCHLAGGTTKFSAPYIGIDALFPQYRGRENTIGSLEERINGCFERSMDGKRLPVDSKEMRSIVAYMQWLSRDVPIGEEVEGRGYPDIEIPDRKANFEHGEQVYANQCASCHQLDGAGLRAGQPGDTLGYIYPPLWGEDSYNNGAGMNRVLTAASFIKHNMPLGATYENPQLTDEEAYDVAAYVNSQARPEKDNLENDYPDLSKKPVDSPYPPYPDSFPQEQHQFGPFQPIIEAHKENENQ